MNNSVKSKMSKFKPSSPNSSPKNNKQDDGSYRNPNKISDYTKRAISIKDTQLPPSVKNSSIHKNQSSDVKSNIAEY